MEVLSLSAASASFAVERLNPSALSSVLLSVLGVSDSLLGFAASDILLCNFLPDDALPVELSDEVLPVELSDEVLPELWREEFPELKLPEEPDTADSPSEELSAAVPPLAALSAAVPLLAALPVTIVAFISVLFPSLKLLG